MSTYPTREETEVAWREMALRIAEDAPTLSDTVVARRGEARGELVILGSGIGVMGFTRDAEQYIAEADHVVFCVADPATQVWLRERRPDALDLYALYDDRKRRHDTYMQMTEAMLYHVRRGKRVAAVYYGHPGIFVLSTHRAVAIARREGHRAELRPGVSALDWLCADLGVDPAYPGMQTFEATDMLLRRRAIDVCSHVVLWQVGLIAEMGFRRRGFHNSHFDHLVDYLLGYYPSEHTVTHYIASRYPSLPPLIEHYRIADLKDRAVQRKISGISTFYIAPGRARPIDLDFAREVGLLRPGQRVGRAQAHRDLDRYGPRELQALSSMKDFRLPPDYHFQSATGAAKFLLALAEQPALRRLYAEDPRAAVKSFPGLSSRERALLASRKGGSVQLAAKGAAVSISPAEQFVSDLYTSPSLRKQWMGMLKTAVQSTPKNWAPVNAWLTSNYQITLQDVGPALDSVPTWLLLAWNGVYATSGATPDVLMVQAGTDNATNAAVYLNASPLYAATFANSQLTFDQSNGNPCSGELTFTQGSGQTPSSVTGKLWRGSTKPSADNFSATLQQLPSNPLSVWTGEYTTTLSGGGAGPHVAVYLPTGLSPTIAVAVDGKAVTGGSFGNNTFTWDSGASSITFSLNSSAAGSLTFTGTISGKGAVTGVSVANAPASFQGEYATQYLHTVNGSQLWQPFYPLAFWQTSKGPVLMLGTQSIPVTYKNRQITWTGGPSAIANGSIWFAVNPFTNAAYFQGVTWTSGSQPSSPNFQGVASPSAIWNFAGSYDTTLDGAAGPVLTIAGGPRALDIKVTYGTTPVKYAFNAGVLSGPAGNAQLGAWFKYVTNTSVKPPVSQPAFNGKVTTNGTAQTWVSTAPSNDMLQWVGTYSTLTVSASNGSFVPGGPTLTISAETASSFTVTLTVGGQTTTISNAQYQTQGNVLVWANQTVAGGSQYANAAISFYVDARGGTKSFQGIYYESGTAPTSVIWKGSLAQGHGGGGGGTSPWVIVGSILGGAVVIGAVSWLVKWCCSSSQGYVRVATEDSIEMEHLKCE